MPTAISSERISTLPVSTAFSQRDNRGHTAPALLEVPVDVDDELDGPRRLRAVGGDGPESVGRDDRVVRARLAGSVIDGRGRRHRRSGPEDREVARGGRLRPPDVDP